MSKADTTPQPIIPSSDLTGETATSTTDVSSFASGTPADDEKSKDPILTTSAPKPAQAQLSILSEIATDSTQPLDFKLAAKKAKKKKNIDLKNIPPETKYERDEKGKITAAKKIYKNHQTDVTITNKIHSVSPYLDVRDVDIKVDKGPAVVSLGMTDINGKRIKNQSFVIEYGEDGKAKEAVPNLDLVQIDKPDPNKPAIAFIEVDGKRVVLPINGEKVEALRAEIVQHKARLHQQSRRVAKETGAETPKPDPRISGIAKKDPKDKTPEDIVIEYKQLIADYAAAHLSDIENSNDKTKAALQVVTQKLEKYQEDHTAPGQAEIIERVRQEQETALKKKAKAELEAGIRSEISAGARHDERGTQEALKAQNKAKAVLKKVFGLKDKQINEIEQKTVKEAALSFGNQAIEAKIEDRDPAGHVVEKNYAKVIAERIGVKPIDVEASFVLGASETREAKRVELTSRNASKKDLQQFDQSTTTMIEDSKKIIERYYGTGNRVVITKESIVDTARSSSGQLHVTSTAVAPSTGLPNAAVSSPSQGRGSGI